MPPVLSVSCISKAFPGVRALTDVSFELRAGEVHGLMGENGAGKSTLVKILCGLYQPDGGKILIDGAPVTLRGPRHSQELGVSPVHQEVQFEPYLSVAENIFLGRQPTKGFGVIDHRKMHLEASQLLEELGAPMDVTVLAETLSTAQRQVVAIARAVSMVSRVIILDEPTSSITAKETTLLFGIVERLKRRGIGIVYISHRMEEIFRICDRVTVFRDGRHIATKPIAETDMADLIRMMIGRDMSELFRKDKVPLGADLLKVTGLTAAGVLHDISFSVKRGEIVGIAGLVGAGRTELARALFGDLSYDSGRIEIDGSPLPAKHTISGAIKNGIALVPEDRKEEG